MKSFKLTLKRVIGCQVLRVDEYQTLLYESAAMLNSRPLTALDSQPDDGVYLLAPGHFLHQTSASVLTSDESPQRACSYTKRWHRFNICCTACGKDRWSIFSHYKGETSGGLLNPTSRLVTLFL